MMARQALWLCAVATLAHLSLAEVDFCLAKAAVSPIYLNGQDPARITFCVEKVGQVDKVGLDVELVTTPSSTYPYDPSRPDDGFEYPLDDINFPPDESWTWADQTNAATNAITKQWIFTPRVGEECVYVTCFRAVFRDPLDSTNDEESTEVRCYRIEVVNAVLHFQDMESYLPSPAFSLIKPPSMDGMFMAGWVYPSCTMDGSEVSHNMTVLSFVSNRDIPDQIGLGLPNDKGLVTRNSIKYMVETGQFFYYDDYIGEVMSKGEYCCEKWHYVGVSITKDGNGTLYVDGASPKLAMEYERDVVKYSAVPFTTSSRPDFTGGSNGASFRVGGGFLGYVDEVSVWDFSIFPEEFDLLMQTRTAKDFMLRGKTAKETMDFTGPVTGGVGNVQPLSKLMAIPPMTGCILGMEHNVGPVDGACVTKVFGWNFADAMFPQCSFGGVNVRAEVIKEEIFPAYPELPSAADRPLLQMSRCTTPGHISPRFVDVTYSNDGINFAQPEKIGRSVKHLFLESSLYVTGEGEGGAEADSVCQDLPSKAVTFGAWVCPKCGPPVPEPPPPPFSPPPPNPPPSPQPPPPSPPPPVQLGEGGIAK